MAQTNALRKAGRFRLSVHQEHGKKPLYASSFVADYLRPAAIAAGVSIAEGQRFGLHNLRHSLSNWLVNKAKVQARTAIAITPRADQNNARALHAGGRG